MNVLSTQYFGCLKFELFAFTLIHECFALVLIFYHCHLIISFIATVPRKSRMSPASPICHQSAVLGLEPFGAPSLPPHSLPIPLVPNMMNPRKQLVWLYNYNQIEYCTPIKEQDSNASTTCPNGTLTHCLRFVISCKHVTTMPSP